MLRVDWNIIADIINVIILFAAVRFFLFKPVNKVINERKEQADSQIEDAKGQKEKAESLKNEYELHIENIEDEKRQLISEAKNSADSEYRRIVGNASQDAAQIRKNASDEAARNQKAAERAAAEEKKKIVSQAGPEIADMVVKAAMKVSAGSAGEDMNRALYDQFLEKAGEKGDTGSD